MFFLILFAVVMFGSFNEDPNVALAWAEIIGITLGVYAVFLLPFRRKGAMIRADLLAGFFALIAGGISALIFAPLALIVMLLVYAFVARVAYMVQEPLVPHY